MLFLLLWGFAFIVAGLFFGKLMEFYTFSYATYSVTIEETSHGYY